MKKEKIFPKKLKRGDEVRVVSPARSMSIISPDVRSIALKRLEELGLKVTFAHHCEEKDIFQSSSVKSRLEDLHEAFEDHSVKAILTTIGGYNSIQLLHGIDYDLIKKNPKIFCGYSDITTLQNSIFAKTGLVTFSGPHFSTFGCLKGIEYVIDYFQRCLFSDKLLAIDSSEEWSDDEWYINQENRTFIPNAGMRVIHPGKATGTIVGGNIDSLCVLQGTDYLPSFHNSILFLEDNYPMTAEIFDRHLHSFMLQKEFQGVKGIVLGRFQSNSKITIDLLKEIIKSKSELASIPVIAEADFGHTLPIFTFPIGGTAILSATTSSVTLDITQSVV